MEARQHVEQMRAQVDSPEHRALSARQRAARKRAAADKLERLEQAIAQLPELKQKQAEAARRAGQGERGEQIRARQPRVSTTDAQARVMKMPNGGFNPAVNVQLATDTGSRTILAVEVSNEGSDSVGLSAPMRQQVEQRTGGKVEQHLIDGGYMRTQDIEQAHLEAVELFVPPKSARSPRNRGRVLEPRPGDSEAVLAWKRRMASETGKEIYKERRHQRDGQRRPQNLSRAEPVHGARPQKDPLRGSVVRPGLQPDALRPHPAGVGGQQT